VFPFPEELPTLDAHAHLAPDVTDAQVRGLNGAVVFAMTRSPTEASYVSIRRDPTIVWGLGIHPTSYRDLAAFDADVFARLVDRFAIVGEVGLDFRGGRRQSEVFREVLRVTSGRPVLLSIHSTGMVGEVLDALAAHTQAGPILHWFVGSSADVERALALGCYFSVNGAMTDAQIELLPRDRTLCETDFPAATRAGAMRPGDTSNLEDRLANLWRMSRPEIRHRLFANARRVAVASEAIELMPSEAAGHLLAA
jgi:TatD DNase family protein